MNDRLKVFVIIGVLGFVAGIIAYSVATYFIPWLIEVMPSISGVAPFLISGIVGAILTVLLVAIWAMLTGKRNYQ
ncbi:MAG: hypothetical protein NWF01_10210 [Candidatus Bathyarchaeota archaeon]|nr:hypothetical protein [Candidatus Bathyarchaeota archaeon]